MSGHQDWKDVKWINKGVDGTKSMTNEQRVNAARRRGKEVDTQKRKTTDQTSGKLDEDDGCYKRDKVTAELRVLLQKERLSAGFRTQKELATACNVQCGLIQAFESGKRMPSPQIIQKIERALRLKNPSFVPGTLSRVRKKSKINK